MESIIYDSVAAVRQLLEKGFEMPIHFAALYTKRGGTNGSILAGTFRFSPSGDDFDCQNSVQPSAAEGLTAPATSWMDRKGEAAVVVLRPLSGEALEEHQVVQ